MNDSILDFDPAGGSFQDLDWSWSRDLAPPQPVLRGAAGKAAIDAAYAFAAGEDARRASAGVI